MVTSTVCSGISFDLCDSIANPFIHSDVINLISNIVTWPSKCISDADDATYS